MDELSQFWVSIFHCREKREQSWRRRAKAGKIKGLTSNILIISQQFPPLLLPPVSSFTSHRFAWYTMSPSPSICMTSITPLHFSLFILSLPRSMVGDVFPSSHPIDSQPILQSRCSTGSAPIHWSSNLLYSYGKMNNMSWCHKGGIKHATFITICLPSSSAWSPAPALSSLQTSYFLLFYLLFTPGAILPLLCNGVIL